MQIISNEPYVTIRITVEIYFGAKGLDNITLWTPLPQNKTKKQWKKKRKEKEIAKKLKKKKNLSGKRIQEGLPKRLRISTFLQHPRRPKKILKIFF